MKKGTDCINKALIVLAGAALISACGCGLLYSGGFSSEGTATADILELSVDARAVALGGAYTSVAEGSNSIYWNPSGLAGLKSDSISFMHGMFFESVVYDYLAYAFPLKKSGVIGVGVQYLNYGSIETRDNLGNKDGSLTPRDTVMNISYSRIMNAIPVGFTLKFINSKILNTAATAAVDAGFQMFFMDDIVAVGGAVRNIGGKLKYAHEADPLPASANFGVSWKYSHSLLLSGEAAVSRNADPYFSAGAEYEFFSINKVNLMGRAGYKTRTIKSELGGLAGLNVGVGIKARLFNFDYAWTPMGELGNNHYVSIGLDFGAQDEQSSVRDEKSRHVRSYRAVRVEDAIDVPVEPKSFARINEKSLEKMLDRYERVLKSSAKELDSAEQFGKAIRLFNEGNYKESYRIYELVNKYSDNNVLVGESQIGLAESAYNMGDAELARTILIDLTNYMPGYRNDDRIKILLAKINIAQGRYERAVRMLEREETEEAVWVRVKAYFESGQFARALAEIYYYYEMYPVSVRDAQRRLIHAEILYASKEYEKAIMEFRGFISDYPESDKVLYCRYMIASSYLLDGRYREAYNRFSELASEKSGKDIASKSLFLKAESAQLLGNIDEALSLYNEVVTKRFGGKLAEDANYRVCLIYLQSNEIKKLERKSRSLSKKYNSAKFAMLYGLTQYLKGKTDKAYTSFNLALEQANTIRDIDRNLVLLSFVGSPVNLNAIIKRQPESPLWERHVAMFFTAEGFFDSGMYFEAEKIFFELKSRTIEPRLRTLAELRYADCLSQQGEYEESYRHFKRIEERPSISPDIDKLLWLGLGHVSYKMNDYTKAVKYYEQLIDEFPDSEDIAQAYYFCGEAYNKKDFYSKAIDMWMQMAKKFPKYPKSKQAITDSLNLAFGMGDYEKVISVATLVPELYNDSEFLLQTKLIAAKALDNMEQYSGAVEIYQDLMSGATEQAVRDQIEKYLSKVYYQIGLSRPDGEIMLDNFAEKYSNHSLIGEVYWLTGAKFFDSGMYDQAEKRFHKVVTEYPHSASAPNAIFYLAESIYWQGRLDDALQYYELYERNYSENEILATTVRFRMANAYFKQGRIPLSIEFYNKILNSGVNSDIRKNSMLNLALGYYRINEVENSIGMFKQFLEEHPDVPEANTARYHVARILRDEGKYDQAIEFYDKVIPEGEITEKELAYRIGESYFEKGDTDNCIDAFSRLMSMRPLDDKFRVNGLTQLGKLLEEKQQYAKAAEVYESLKKSMKKKELEKLFDAKIRDLIRKQNGNP